MIPSPYPQKVLEALATWGLSIDIHGPRERLTTDVRWVARGLARDGLVWGLDPSGMSELDLKRPFPKRPPPDFKPARSEKHERWGKGARQGNQWDAPASLGAVAALDGWHVTLTPEPTELSIGRPETRLLVALEAHENRTRQPEPRWDRLAAQDPREVGGPLGPPDAVAVLSAEGRGLMAWLDRGEVQLAPLDPMPSVRPAAWRAAAEQTHLGCPRELETHLFANNTAGDALAAVGRALALLRPRSPEALWAEHARRRRGRPSPLREALRADLAVLGPAWRRVGHEEALEGLGALNARLRDGETGTEPSAGELGALCAARDRLERIARALALVGEGEALAVGLGAFDRRAVPWLASGEMCLVVSDPLLADLADDADDAWWLLPARQGLA